MGPNGVQRRFRDTSGSPTCGHVRISCPIPRSSDWDEPLKQWKNAFLSYFDTGRVNGHGGSEPIDGLIELHRRITCETYRLRMLLIDQGLTPPSPRV